MARGLHTDQARGSRAIEEEMTMTKRPYRKPGLRRLGLLRQITRFSF
jgi:hypothetical protein